jgi:hypothetical protein
MVVGVRLVADKDNHPKIGDYYQTLKGSYILQVRMIDYYDDRVTLKQIYPKIGAAGGIWTFTVKQIVFRFTKLDKETAKAIYD